MLSAIHGLHPPGSYADLIGHRGQLMLIGPWIELAFRFIMYVFCGFSMEIIFAVKGIELCVGVPIPRRVPGKYLEGFVSLYMIPIHGFG
ncbi:MAG: hypothetical protein AABY86_03490, partial [Bdellovibrionota bacterium]